PAPAPPGPAPTNFGAPVPPRRGDADPRTQLVLGPWVHGGQARTRAGERDFGVGAAIDYPDLGRRFLGRPGGGAGGGRARLRRGRRDRLPGPRAALPRPPRARARRGYRPARARLRDGRE